MSNNLLSLLNYKSVFLFLFIISISIYAIYITIHGPLLSPDSLTFSSWSDQLIKFNFDINIYLNSFDSTKNPPIFYFAFIYLLSLVKVFFGDNWQIAFIILNLISIEIIILITYYLTYKLTNSVLCSVYSSLSIIFCLEIILWVPFVLTDIIFCFLSTLSLILFIYSFNKKNFIRYLFLTLFIFINLLILFFRPSGLPIFLSSFLSFLVVFTLEKINFKFDLKFIKIIFNLIFATSIFISFLYLYILYNYENLALNLPIFLDNLIILFKDGLVIHSRYETYSDDPIIFYEYFFLLVKRIVYLFAFYLDSYSNFHNIGNIIIFLPIYILCILGIYLITIKKITLKNNFTKLFILYFIVFMFANIFFISFTFMDYDFRYRLPLMPLMIIFSSIPLNYILNFLRFRF